MSMRIVDILHVSSSVESSRVVIFLAIMNVQADGDITDANYLAPQVRRNDWYRLLICPTSNIALSHVTYSIPQPPHPPTPALRKRR